MIQLKNISKGYDKSLFDNFSLEIPKDKITCILGESGVGKTTLLKMIAGLTDYQGQITGVTKLSYIFQEERLIPSLTVYGNLRFICPTATEEQIKSLLQALEIADKGNAYPSQLSGGEAQRVSIARAFLYDAPLILMDEPFSSLDLTLKYKLIQYFCFLWNQNPKTVIFVTHDIDEAIMLGHHIHILKDGHMDKSYVIEDCLPRTYGAHPELRKQIIENFI